MIAFSLSALFATVALATLLGLTDCWMRGRRAFASLQRERAMVKAGFVPVVEAQELRLRQNSRFAGSASRPFAHRLPARSPVPAIGAA